MFLFDLFEDQAKRVVVVYAGRFQPFHKGHKAVYDYLTQKFGRENVYISTSDKVDPPRSPFNFQEKVTMMKLTGINPSNVIQSAQPYRSEELVSKLDPSNTIILFAVSQKDMDTDPRFSFNAKKDGSPSYFQPKPQSLRQAQTLDKHGYIMVVPTFDFTVLGKPMEGATEIRTEFANSDDETKRAIIKDLFGNYSDEVFHLMNTKVLAEALENGLNPKYARVSKYAQLRYPYARSEQEALTLYMLDQEKSDVTRLDQVNQIEDNMIAKLQDLDVLLQAKIDNLQKQLYDLKPAE